MTTTSTPATTATAEVATSPADRRTRHRHASRTVDALMDEVGVAGRRVYSAIMW